jgi:hypothetical protein
MGIDYQVWFRDAGDTITHIIVSRNGYESTDGMIERVTDSCYRIIIQGRYGFDEFKTMGGAKRYARGLYGC